MEDCIFCKISKGEIPTDFVYQDEDFVAFRDIKPAAPVHILIVPKKHIGDFITSAEIVHSIILKIAKKLIKKFNLDKSGYRLVINGGGAAFISHFHLHLLGRVTINREL